jgi:hypothetical protein
MLSTSDEMRFFDSCKPDLMAFHQGEFAVVCGRKLVGVHASLAGALEAAAQAFGAGVLEEGAPILISEIAEHARLRVIAEPRATAAALPRCPPVL